MRGVFSTAMRQLFVNMQEKARAVTSALLSSKQDVLIQPSLTKDPECCVCVKSSAFYAVASRSRERGGHDPG